MDYEHNEEYENELPFSFVTFPESGGALKEIFDKAKKASSHWKLLQRLKIQYDSQMNATYGSLWDKFALELPKYLLLKCRKLSLEEIEEYCQLLSNDLNELLSFRPETVANLVALFLLSIYRSIEDNIDGMDEIVSKWSREQEGGGKRKPLAHFVLNCITECFAFPWNAIIDERGSTNYETFEMNLKAIYFFFRMFTIREEELALTCSIVPILFSQRWCLSDWCGFPAIPEDSEDGPLPWDSLTGVIDDKPLDPKDLLAEWRCILLAAKILRHMACPNDVPSNLPKWVDHSNLEFSDIRFYFIPEMFKILGLACLSSFRLDTSKFPSKTVKEIQSILTETILIVQEYIEKANSVWPYVILSEHWIRPVLAFDCVDSKLKKIVTKFSDRLSLKLKEPITPLSLWDRRPLGVKALAPLYVHIEDPEFFQKAKSIRIISEADKEVRKSKRQINDERRKAAKEIRRDANVVKMVEWRENLKHQARQDKKRKHFETIIQQDAAEFNKLKTMSGKDVRQKKPKRERASSKRSRSA